MNASVVKFLLPLASLAALPSSAAELKELLTGRGMWVQHPGKTAALQLATLGDLGVRRLHIMVTHATSPYKDCAKAAKPKLTSNLPQLVELVRLSKVKGFAVIATVYAAPSRQHIEDLLSPGRGAVSSLVQAGVDGIEYDLEGGWSRASVCGYGTHEEAARSLYRGTRALKAGLPVGVTTHLARAQDEHIARGEADWVSLQAYAKCEIGNCVDFDDKREGPGSREGRVPTELGSYKGWVILGLAAFNQKWPSHSVQEAMTNSLNTFHALTRANGTYVGYSYWSATWALRNAEVQQFLASTAN